MSTLFYLSSEQIARIEPYFPLPHGVPGVDDRRIVSGSIHVIKHGMQWNDAPREYGPHKPLYNRFIRWSRPGVFNKIFAELVEQNDPTTHLMIDATHLKAHRTGASLLKKGLFPAVSDAQRAD
jgi:transposase